MDTLTDLHLINRVLVNLDRFSLVGFGEVGGREALTVRAEADGGIWECVTSTLAFHDVQVMHLPMGFGSPFRLRRAEPAEAALHVPRVGYDPSEESFRVLLLAADGEERFYVYCSRVELIGKFVGVWKSFAQMLAHTDHEAFFGFLVALASGGGTAEEWQRFAIAQFAEPRFEQGRRELFRTAGEASGWSWPAPPQSLRDAARVVYERLVYERPRRFDGE